MLWRVPLTLEPPFLSTFSCKITFMAAKECVLWCCLSPAAGPSEQHPFLHPTYVLVFIDVFIVFNILIDFLKREEGRQKHQ